MKFDKDLEGMMYENQDITPLHTDGSIKIPQNVFFWDTHFGNRFDINDMANYMAKFFREADEAYKKFKRQPPVIIGDIMFHGTGNQK